MTPDLNERWLNRRPPFDGWTVSPAGDELVSLPCLLNALRGIVERLERVYTIDSIFRVADWHEHDGHLSEAAPTDWDEICRWLASEEALYAAGHDDTEVRIAMFPQAPSFYLRFYVPRDYDRGSPERRGSFDLTGGQKLIGEIAALIERDSDLTVVRVPAKSYFDRSYGG